MRHSNGSYTYLGVLDIPEATVGKFAIEHVRHPANEPMKTANFRTSLLGGHKCKTLSWPHATRWHKLTGPTGTWMTDFPIEQAQHDRELAPISFGRVLVGGLGLGYAASVLARNARVEAVTVVEKSREVIELTWGPLLASLTPKNRKKLRVVRMDLFKWLREVNQHGPDSKEPWGSYDNAFYDIWQLDGLSTFFNVVLPLRRLSSHVRNEVVNWNESVMRGQLFNAIQGRVAVMYLDMKHPEGHITLGNPEEVGGTITVPLHEKSGFTKENLLKPLKGSRSAKYHNWQIPYWKWYFKRERPIDLAFAIARMYSDVYGLRDWRPAWANIIKGV